jgi:hypothetical protein
VGICDSHVGTRSLVGKTYRQGFFWPTAVSDADSLVRRYEGCQFFARQKHVLSHQLQTWGLHVDMKVVQGLLCSFDARVLFIGG